MKMGYVGVDIFFVLSGFIISHVHMSDFIHFSRRRILEFLSLRLCRIYPVHAATLAFTIAFAGALAMLGVSIQSNLRFALGLLGANITLVQAWGWVNHGSWNIVAWSISAEWLAYLGFPFLAWALSRASSMSAAITWAALICMFLPFAVAVQGHALDITNTWAPVRVLIEFSAGACACRLWQSCGHNMILCGWIADFALVAMMLGAWSGSYPCTALAAFILVPALASGHGLTVAVLRSRPLMHLGVVSYSLYMVHFLVIEVVFSPLSYSHLDALGTGPRSAVLALALMAVFIATELTNRYVEVPARTILRSALERMQTRRMMPVARSTV
jgi:peptidoglycan/LPS O-acetylase OafA/YrhL